MITVNGVRALNGSGQSPVSGHYIIFQYRRVFRTEHVALSGLSVIFFPLINMNAN